MQNPHTPHILGSFEQALITLRSDVLMMASLTTRSFVNAGKGLFDRNVACCGVAIADDEEVDDLEIQIDREGVDILMKFQPVASDMREVIASMKMSSNLERVADQVVSIARRAKKLSEEPQLPELPLLQPMFDMAMGMFTDSVKYYADSDVEAARGMKPRDRELDQLNRSLTEAYSDCITKNVGRLKGYLNLIFICRILERIGDHATNVCEEVVFVGAAEDIRHSYSAKKNPSDPSS